MLDFFIISKRITKNGIEVYPKFIIRSTTKDLMIRGGDFYAIWNEETQLWSTNEDTALYLIDKALDEYAATLKDTAGDNVKVLHMWDAENCMIDKWHKYCQKQMRDTYHALDEKIIFSNMPVKKDDYASKKLSYPLEAGDYAAYDELMSVLYSPEERKKIEWAIGSIVTGDSVHIQKFIVMYGDAGTGKSTVMNIIQDLFDGYYSTFDAKALGSASAQFALEPFKMNPLVAIQHDGDLSRIEDNTRLNSVASHEFMTVNEKHKSMYTNRFNCFMFMGTNKPVKITDAKSGILRRLIDVSPTGKKVSIKRYRELTHKIKFELSGIAYHCAQVYSEDPDAYNSYVPVSMMGASNDFYNFVLDSYEVFKRNSGTTLKAAWEMYKLYCEDARVPYPYSQRLFKEELKNYFETFEERATVDGDTRVRNYYSGFLTKKFEYIPEEPRKMDDWLVFEERDHSILDVALGDCPAQYAEYVDGRDKPQLPWSKVTTKLVDIDPHKLHYILMPFDHIFIDFDIPDENGNKCFEKNLEAARKWTRTYAELSKSGQGIHLHYIYTGGDPLLLSAVYDDHIEIKVRRGNMSLRRKLSKCNNEQIATISSGLPLREEKKVLNVKQIKSEEKLRELIKENLRKKYHPGTKPSIDFIFKILEDAYASGLSYDVTDMRPDVLRFASGSTHQASYCIKLVNDMKWHSETMPDNEEDFEHDVIIFYDVEIFPNLCVVCWMRQGSNKVVSWINPSPEQIEDLIKYKLVGFNNRRYDNHILYAIMTGYNNEQLYNLSQRIISGSRNAMFAGAYNISYTDIYDFASAGNKKSLKKLEIEMGIHHQELGLPWDQPVPEDLWEKVADYCQNDVRATAAAFDYLKSDFMARQILADLAEMTVNDSTNALTQRIIFGKNRNPQTEFNYRDLAKPVKELDPDTMKFLKKACPDMMAQRHGPANSLLPYWPGYTHDGKSMYRDEETGEGGYVYAEPGMYFDVTLLDIASMHPHSAIAEALFGARYTTAFRDIVEGRVSIKHKAWNEVDSILDGKLTPYIQRVKDGEFKAKDLANALKTAINSVYGLTWAGFDNCFRDKRNVDNIVAKRGALFMIDLKHEVQARGFTVVHIKTDSIKIHKATPEIISFCMDFAKRYGYTFEHEATYDRMCLVNDAVYIAKYASKEWCQKKYGYIPGDNIDHPEQWTATGTQFQVPYVFKSLFGKELIEFEDLCETKAVSQGDLYLDMNESLPDVTNAEKELKKVEKELKKIWGANWQETLEAISEHDPTMFTQDLVDHSNNLIRDYINLKNEIARGHNYIYVGRVGQFCPIKPGNNGGVLYRMKDGKYYAAAGTKGYRWLESEVVQNNHKEDAIDRSYFAAMVDEAICTIQEYGDIETFVD